MRLARWIGSQLILPFRDRLLDRFTKFLDKLESALDRQHQILEGQAKIQEIRDFKSVSLLEDVHNHVHGWKETCLQFHLKVEEFLREHEQRNSQKPAGSGPQDS